ncbi:MAG TPA: helix-turn-helix domain-containing protein [Solirubrobacterales bacterium]|nr:helix-turn-helix domain-containing protein [Solirubrobacterales bacterium]
MPKTTPARPPALDDDPWRGLPARVADLIEGEIEPITVEILDSIAREVPEYARPLEGRFGRGIRRGVGEALAQFVALIRDPDAGRDSGREVYLTLGRGEQRAGRTLDSLQAAYRIGARVAWRRFADACRRAGVGAEPLALLAEAVFAYIDELAADSVEGYAQARAEVEDLRRRRRRELLLLLLAEPPADAGDVAAAARAAAWDVPAGLAALACPEEALARVTRRLPPEALVTVVDGEGCLLLPDPEGPGRAEALDRAAAETTLVLGPTVAPAAAARSWALARALLRADSGGAVSRAAGRPAAAARAPGDGRDADRAIAAGEGKGRRVGAPLRVDDNLATLVLLESRELAARIAARRLAALADLTPKARARMRETALAHLRHDGNAVAMATEMHVHPQTARYRIARLRELLGDQLDDPDARFELQLALRAEELGASF